MLSPQNSFYRQLHEQKKSEKFFKVLYDRMKAAQKEIRSTVTVNTIDLGSKKRDDDNDLIASGPRMRGEELPKYLGKRHERRKERRFKSQGALPSCFWGLLFPVFPVWMSVYRGWKGLDHRIALRDQTKMRFNWCGSSGQHQSHWISLFCAVKKTVPDFLIMEIKL